MTHGDRIAAGALALRGVPFRLHGRDPAIGIDCVGLVLLALRAAGYGVNEPPRYTLRGTGRARAEALFQAAGLVRVGAAATGDILLAQSGPMQLHLMISAAGGAVQAHAGLGRVVLTPFPTPWPLLSLWRAMPHSEEG